MALDIYIDPITGGYELINNKFTYVETAVNKANVLLTMKLNSYLYAPQDGNSLLNEQGIMPITNISKGINACLQPLITNGDITNVTILSWEYSTITQRYKINLLLNLPNGESPLITWIK